MAKLFLDICLSDIPKERINTAANGKKYLKAMVSPRKEADRDGYDHYLAVWIPKAERHEGDKPLFFGRAQEKTQQQQRQQFYGYPRNDGSGGKEDFPF